MSIEAPSYTQQSWLLFSGCFAVQVAAAGRGTLRFLINSFSDATTTDVAATIFGAFNFSKARAQKTRHLFYNQTSLARHRYFLARDSLLQVRDDTFGAFGRSDKNAHLSIIELTHACTWWVYQ